MKEFIYGGLILIVAILLALFLSFTMPETVTFVTIILGSIIAAIGTYIASYRAQKYLQDRSEKKVYIKTVFYPLYRELEENTNILKTGRKIKLITNIWVYTLNSPDFLSLSKELRTKLEKLYEEIKVYNSLIDKPEKEIVQRDKIGTEIAKMMKVLEEKMKDK